MLLMDCAIAIAVTAGGGVVVFRNFALARSNPLLRPPTANRFEMAAVHTTESIDACLSGCTAGRPQALEARTCIEIWCYAARVACPW